MRQSFVRSLLSSIVAACFALSISAWGTMPECPPGNMAAMGHGSPPAGPTHPGEHPHAPAHQSCVVHLCCAHVAPQARVTLAVGRTAALLQVTPFAAVAAVSPRRPPHSLPFAHAPPDHLV